MRVKKMLIFLLSFGIFFSTVQSTMAVPDQENNDETNKGKDSIEWVAMWDEPTTREGKLERMLTTELQRRTLFALQEKNYLKPGKQHVYYFDPFKITDMRTVDGGFYQLDVLAGVHQVIGNKPHNKIIMMINDENFKSQYFLLKSNERETKILLDWVEKCGLFN